MKIMKRLTKEFTMLPLILYRVVVYKAPAQNTGKALIAGANANAWQSIQDITVRNGHAVVKSLEHVIMADNTNKFIAYNNIPPDIPKVKTKSNSKGVLMMNPEAQDEASWIVHTIPGFPKALTGYVFPPAEIQKGHLFICLTIKESEIDAIAVSVFPIGTHRPFNPEEGTWDTWILQFRSYLEINFISDSNLMRSCLLASLTPKAFEELRRSCLPTTPYDFTYDECVAKMKELYGRRVILMREGANFFRIAQLDHQTPKQLLIVYARPQGTATSSRSTRKQH
ncbi:hypothetical protein T02_12726 [Trichinella nativa]|uniref:Uncharacterized protein n=1 Tax=Trichinella nativa TaxID=6335 RepID=A0A0V1L689_9BILA|nr:hypothetical protein T02_12726 [Trichinella nativa]